MTAPTPAIDRAAQAGSLAYMSAMASATVPHVWRCVAGTILTAALTDPDDPDSLARALFVLNAGMYGWSATSARVQWEDEYNEATREHWRAVADGFRMMLTGSGS